MNILKNIAAIFVIVCMFVGFAHLIGKFIAHGGGDDDES